MSDEKTEDIFLSIHKFENDFYTVFSSDLPPTAGNSLSGSQVEGYFLLF